MNYGIFDTLSLLLMEAQNHMDRAQTVQNDTMIQLHFKVAQWALDTARQEITDYAYTL